MSNPLVIENSQEMKEDVPPLSPVGDKKETTVGMLSWLLRLDKSKAPSETERPPEPAETYYAVYIPCEIKRGPDEEALHVYKDRARALELVRRYKPARFKTFGSMQDAVAFALRGADPDNPDSSATLIGEKPYPFKGPSPQDLVALRKLIESGAAAAVRDTIWDNPRYLVSSGNTPTILQEGSRYNALHVAAKAQNAELCDAVLTTVGDPLFARRLYGDVDEHTCREFAELLVDRYLNTPDKGLNETPLHFAVKFGAADVVDVLTSFSQCNKNAVNKYGELPKDMICRRSGKSDPQVAERIERLLRERFYVPVFHSEDDSRQPTIGNIFTPSTPPEVNRDPLSPRLEIRAYAGPMSPQEAQQFRRRWKTPPRSVAARTPLASPAFRLNEISKGLESVGRTLAEQMKVGWKEYWPFLDTFTDLRTKEGLSLLENHFSKEYQAAYSQVISNSKDLSLSHIEPGVTEFSPISGICEALRELTLGPDGQLGRRKSELAPRTFRISWNGEHVKNHTVNPLMNIEKTCQVFAQRIVDLLLLFMDGYAPNVVATLEAEAKHLDNTMASYMEDERFQSIRFELIHHRVAHLIVFKILQRISDNDSINTLIEFLDCLTSVDEMPNEDKKSRMKRVNVGRHVDCIATFIKELFSCSEGRKAQGPLDDLEVCASTWAEARKCACAWDRDRLDRHNRRNASFKRKQRRRSMSPHYVKKLFPCNETDDVPPAPLVCVNMDKCRVLPSTELLSEDESDKSSPEDEPDVYLTASEGEEGDDDKMADTSDVAAVETFIYGEEPSKMDRLVYDAVCDVSLDPALYPHLYRWRHTVGLYPREQRNKWQPFASDDSVATPIKGTLNLGMPLFGSPVSHANRRLIPEACSSPIARTPKKTDTSASETTRNIPLQVSSWLRVTGPNSPRSVVTNKNVGHNVSFGF